MIICKNCGAEYDDEQDRCPYCGGDNFGKSVQVHEDMMNELKREKRQWEKMPEKVAGKGMSWTAKLGIAAVIMVAVICIIVFIVSDIHRFPHNLRSGTDFLIFPDSSVLPDKILYGKYLKQ